jgi:hypothetical protein
VATKTAAAALKGGQTKDFSAGANIRDASPELAANELADAWNITLDERGGASSRLGYSKYNGTVFDPGAAVINTYASPILATTITQVGAKLYKGTSNASVKTFTSSATVTFAELNSLVIANHPVDGLFTSPDGVTWTPVADADAPKGNGTCIAVWQNKLFVGRTDGAVQWSAAGDATNWVATDFNKLWEHDQQGIVALHIGSGQDILGKPGLLCFKQESTYRINDSTTGAYTTVDATVGAAGPKAVVGVGARVITISKRGIFWWREDQSGMVNASDQLLPLWDPTQINLGQQALWCAGRKNNRAIFSLTRGTSTANDLALEFHPDQGWIAPRSDAMSCYATLGGGNELLYGGSPTVNGQVYQLESQGTDDGAPIAYRLQTRWFELNSGFESVVWQLRIHGRGLGTMTVRKDYASGGGDNYSFNLNGTLNTYDSGLKYDSGIDYSIPAFQNTEPFYNVGTCRQFSLVFAGTSSTVVSAPQVLGAGVAPLVGSFGLYGIEWLFVPLGLS